MSDKLEDSDWVYCEKCNATWWRNWGHDCQGDEIDALRRVVDRLTAERDALREALDPFAQSWRDYLTYLEWHNLVDDVFTPPSNFEREFAAAYAVLRELPVPPEGEA